jgi:hypothetical protein
LRSFSVKGEAEHLRSRLDLGRTDPLWGVPPLVDSVGQGSPRSFGADTSSVLFATEITSAGARVLSAVGDQVIDPDPASVADRRPLASDLLDSDLHRANAPATLAAHEDQLLPYGKHKASLRSGVQYASTAKAAKVSLAVVGSAALLTGDPPPDTSMVDRGSDKAQGSGTDRPHLGNVDEQE